MNTFCTTLLSMERTIDGEIIVSTPLKALNSHLQVTELIAFSCVKQLSFGKIMLNIW